MMIASCAFGRASCRAIAGAAAFLALGFAFTAEAQQSFDLPEIGLPADRGNAADDLPQPDAADTPETTTGDTSLKDIPPGDVPPTPTESAPPLRFAVLAGRSTAETMAAVDPIADEIGAIIGRPVELLAMSGYRAMIDAQVERRIDGGFYSATAFAIAQSRCDCLEPIVAPRASDGTTAYNAVIVARAGVGIASALDLEGKTIAVGARDSLGARRMQLAGLMASGIDPETFFGGVLQVASAEEAVRRLRDGQVDAAFAWSSLAGDAATGYSRGTLADLVASGEITMDDFVIIWRSQPIAHGPFAVLKTLSAAEKDKIGSYFLALEASRPEAYDMLNPFYAGGYAPVEAKDYAGLDLLTRQNVDALSLPKAVARVAAPAE